MSIVFKKTMVSNRYIAEIYSGDSKTVICFSDIQFSDCGKYVALIDDALSDGGLDGVSIAELYGGAVSLARDFWS